jgi:hypothetical protein
LFFTLAPGASAGVSENQRSSVSKLNLELIIFYYGSAQSLLVISSSSTDFLRMHGYDLRLASVPIR